MRFLLKAPFLVAISSACLFGQPASLHVSASPSASTVHITAPPPLGRALAGAPYIPASKSVNTSKLWPMARTSRRRRIS
jgi:hypothetical protein